MEKHCGNRELPKEEFLQEAPLPAFLYNAVAVQEFNDGL